MIRDCWDTPLNVFGSSFIVCLHLNCLLILRYSTLIFWCCLQLDLIFMSSNIHLLFDPLNLSLKFEEWLMRYSTLIILHFKQFSIWSPQLKFKWGGRSNRRLLKYSTSIFWGHLPLKCVFHWRSSLFQPTFNLGLVPSA